MWNQFNTGDYEGMLAETITISGHDGDSINAYFSRPLGQGPFPSILLVHHLPGWDEFYRETARRFTHHGYVVISPNFFSRFGQGAPDDIAAAARGGGGVADDAVVGDCEASLTFLRSLPYNNGKVGIIGTCSGGRHSYLVACRVQGFDAVVDCWGGNLVTDSDQLTPQQPVHPIDYTAELSCPVLGLFGNDDQNPNPEQVDQFEAELKRHRKTYDFHRYDGAGHGFWYYHTPMYRPQQAMDAWGKTFAFFGEHLAV